MIRTLILCLYLIYYWYFYASTEPIAPKPSSPFETRPPRHDYRFVSTAPHQFRFVVDGRVAWEHTLPTSLAIRDDKIVRTDACLGTKDGTFVPARGRELYDYLKSNDETNDVLKFAKNSRFTVQQRGDAFYFECANGHVEKIHICPSGSTFVSDACRPVGPCTDKPDGFAMPHSEDARRYVLCTDGGREVVRDCPRDEIFYHDRCEPADDLTHYCDYFPDRPLRIDDTTMVECRNGKPFYVRCTEPGTRFFDKNYCEPDDCVGRPDGARLPLPIRRIEPFHFVPGYSTCRGGKVEETAVECPNDWDDALSKGDDLTFLPTVFDGVGCSVPTFCENVFADDPDVVVPVHEFTKHVKNWKLSPLYDRLSGYSCEGNVRKRKTFSGALISTKRFKLEGCRENLPIVGDPKRFYDCSAGSTVACPASHFFDGSACVPEPSVAAFRYKGLPLFAFDSLNEESWIEPWTRSNDPIPPACDDKYLSLYNICSHPDCEKYAFLSQIPDLAILLPNERSKCKFYDDGRRLKKEPVVDIERYDFWEQRALPPDGAATTESCTPGQKLKTGNFVWDSAIFATCDENQPFVFCPNSRSVIRIDPYHACDPPILDTYVLDRVDRWISFSENEIKSILPTTDDQFVFLNGEPVKLPDGGLDVESAITLRIDRPVKIRVRYRVTHPPNVAFEYRDDENIETKMSTPDRGFVVGSRDFTTEALNFPKYETVHFVDSFDRRLYV